MISLVFPVRLLAGLVVTCVLSIALSVQWGSWVVIHPLARRQGTDFWEASIVRLGFRV